MKRFYGKIVRKSYRMLRSPSVRRIGFLNRWIEKLFDRRLWRPNIHSVAVGLSIGVFCSMLPIPFQMVVAALLCLIGRGTIPVAVAACWISNPITQAPLVFAQNKLGELIRDWSEWNLLEKIDKDGIIPFIKIKVNLADYLVGVFVTAVVGSIIAFLLVYCVYGGFDLYKRTRLSRKIEKHDG